MSIVVKARHMDATDAIKDYVEKRAAKLTKFYNRLHNIEVVLDIEADKPSVEVVASAAKKSTFVKNNCRNTCTRFIFFIVTDLNTVLSVRCCKVQGIKFAVIAGIVY